MRACHKWRGRERLRQRFPIKVGQDERLDICARIGVAALPDPCHDETGQVFRQGQFQDEASFFHRGGRSGIRRCPPVWAATGVRWCAGSPPDGRRGCRRIRPGPAGGDRRRQSGPPGLRRRRPRWGRRPGRRARAGGRPPAGRDRPSGRWPAERSVFSRPPSRTCRAASAPFPGRGRGTGPGRTGLEGLPEAGQRAVREQERRKDDVGIKDGAQPPGGLHRAFR